MSERALRRRRMLAVPVALMVALAVAATPAAGQRDAATLRVLADSAEARAEVAEAEYRAAIQRRRIVSADTMRAAGIPIVLVPAGTGEGDRSRLAEGMERGRAALVARWGPGADLLIDTVSWRLTAGTRRFVAIAPLTLSSGNFARRAQMELRKPIDPARVERFVWRHASLNVVRAIPALTGFAGDEIPLDEQQLHAENAARELALAWSSPARRCYGGSLPDCRRILARPADADRVDTWFDAADHRALAAAHAGDIAPRDTTRQRLRARCNGGDDAACTAFVRSFPAARFPLSTNPRATFVAYALARTDAAGFERLRAAPATASTDVVALLSGATGIDADSLVAGWRASTRESLDRSRPGPFPLLATTTLWGLVLLGVSTRRRSL